MSDEKWVKAVAVVGGGRWSCAWCGSDFRSGHFEQTHMAFVKHFLAACEEILPKGKQYSQTSKGKKWKWGEVTFYKVSEWDAYSFVSNHVKVHFAVDYDQLQAIYDATKEALAVWDAKVYRGQTEESKK
jgi:hypothetical protein